MTSISPESILTALHTRLLRRRYPGTDHRTTLHMRSHALTLWINDRICSSCGHFYDFFIILGPHTQQKPLHILYTTARVNTPHPGGTERANCRLLLWSGDRKLHARGPRISGEVDERAHASSLRPTPGLSGSRCVFFPESRVC